ncbi:MAG: ribosomal protein S18-alanine N-acetyltransferase [Pyrinomonadaceae bacterium]
MDEESIREVKEIEIKCGLSPWSLEDYKKEILRDDSVCLIAKNNLKVSGFIIARLIMQEVGETPQNKNDRELLDKELLNEAEIYNLAVLPGNRQEGIGKALFNQFLDKTKELGISRVWLEVRESNAAAINFYKKNNFQKIQVRKNFYRFPEEDGWVMRLELKTFAGDGILQ